MSRPDVAALLVLALACPSWTACGGTPADPAAEPGAMVRDRVPGRITVAATVAPHAWLVGEIAGDDAEVVTVLPPSADPHTYLPTDAEATRLARASLLFRSGVPFENGAWFEALASRGAVSVDLRADVDLLAESHRHSGDGHETGHEDSTHSVEADVGHGADPHTWLSPRRLAIQARTVASALSDAFPDRSAEITRRTASVITRLEALDAELSERLAPYRGRSFLVLHPSWGYFAADYALEQMAVEAGGSDPSDAELTALLRRAQSAAVRTVFVQPQSAQRVPAVLAEALGARVETLDPLAPDVPANLRRAADRLIESW